jgi:hypothetical protein
LGGILVEDGAEGRSLTMPELQKLMSELESTTRRRTDMMAVAESRLFEQKVRTMMVPTFHPVEVGEGSGFGWRIDPFTGRAALHTGIDFLAPPGTPVLAAAGGVVVRAELRPDYGNVIDIDHGNDVVTRYAHNSKLFIKQGDLVKRGQEIALSGSTGRSTGPHMHFEVLVHGIPQDPNRFLSASGRRLDQQLRFASSIQASGLPPKPQPHQMAVGLDASPDDDTPAASATASAPVAATPVAASAGTATPAPAAAVRH